MKFEVSLWLNTPSSNILVSLRAIFFCCFDSSIYKDKRLSNPCGIATMILYSMNLAVREAIAFVIYNTQIFIRKMLSSMKVCKGAKHSNTQTRQFHETKRSLKEKIRNLELREKIECDEKNFAYSFILSQGYYHEFAQYHRKNHGKNGHKMCVDSLINSI